MNQRELRRQCDQIIARGIDDPEAGHSLEDDMLRKVIQEFCPSWVVTEIRRLAGADFERWTA